jgi:hypothetical protein
MTGRPEEDRELLRELDALSRDRGRAPGDAPPAAVDAAVLARARAAAGRRRVPAWWIPATLAATVVIAFSLMLRVQEEAVTVPAAMDATGPGEEPVTAAARAAAPASAEVAGTAPRVASEAAPSAPPPPPAASSQADVATLRGAASAKAAAPMPDPEAWLAKIEALEAAGRTEEAAAERERLEAAYPGWLEQRIRGRD